MYFEGILVARSYDLLNVKAPSPGNFVSEDASQ
jgi:hypothetical protein